MHWGKVAEVVEAVVREGVSSVADDYSPAGSFQTWGYHPVMDVIASGCDSASLDIRFPALHSRTAVLVWLHPWSTPVVLEHSYRRPAISGRVALQCGLRLAP